MTRNKAVFFRAIAALAALPLMAAQPPTQRERWNEPQQPFRVFGNTWWVGTHGIGSVLITSLAVSATGFRFTGTTLSQAFEKGFATLESLPCDILLAAHPAPAQVCEKLAARDAGKADAFVDGAACRQYVAAARKNLETRLATERRR